FIFLYIYCIIYVYDIKSSFFIGRNKIPLKDYEKKDLESKNDFTDYDTINVTGK
ncbi:acriflavin resistance protein, partial [Brachyspira hampsonii 30599]